MASRDDFGRADNAHCKTEIYLGTECLMSLHGLAAEQRTELYSDLRRKSPCESV